MAADKLAGAAAALFLILNIACASGWAYVLLVVAQSGYYNWIQLADTPPLWPQVRLVTLGLEAACCMEVGRAPPALHFLLPSRGRAAHTPVGRQVIRMLAGSLQGSNHTLFALPLCAVAPR